MYLQCIFNSLVCSYTNFIHMFYFVVQQCGYKMCARIYPNGDGIGKGSHISLFFVIMRGHYDALLPWPFSQKVRGRKKNMKQF